MNFFRNAGEMPPGPPAERPLSLLITRVAKNGVKPIDGRPVLLAERGCMSGSLPLSAIN